LQAGEPDPFVDIINQTMPQSGHPSPVEEEMEPIVANFEQTTSWSASWIQELFEDGFSILAFGADFLPQFKRILNRINPEGDTIHPPVCIRLWFAEYLLNENTPIPQSLADKHPDLLPIAQKTAELLEKHLSKPDEAVIQKILEATRQHATEAVQFDPEIETWLQGLTVDRGVIQGFLDKHSDGGPFYKTFLESKFVFSEMDFFDEITGGYLSNVTVYYQRKAWTLEWGWLTRA